MTERLSTATLHARPGEIATPAYDRASVTPGIVHLGIGAFHRAHQAVFIDDCLGRGETDWGIVAASLRNPATRDALAPQDNLYTYCERDGHSETLRVIGSIGEIIVAPEDPAHLIEVLSRADIRIVTLTVTEKGYLADLATQRLQEDHADIRHDLLHPGEPRSIYGFLIAAFQRRREAGAVPLTLVSCDNLPSNGRVLHSLLCQYAEKTDAGLAAYIRANVSCPCSMVDRIVPATTDEDRAAISAKLGVTDAWPVLAEPYFRWVIEDRFPHGRPKLELSGAEFVDEIEPYEHMKLRMLNGAHTAIAAIGQTAGLETVDQIFADPRVANFIDAYWAEIEPTLRDEVDGSEYVAGLRRRFANASIKHKAVQIASDASQKVPQRILSPLRELMNSGRKHGAVMLALALWIRSCAEKNEHGEPITIIDPAFNEWSAPDQESATPEEIVNRFLGFERVFGVASKNDTDFAAELLTSYRSITEHGVLAALEQAYLEN